MKKIIKLLKKEEKLNKCNKNNLKNLSKMIKRKKPPLKKEPKKKKLNPIINLLLNQKKLKILNKQGVGVGAKPNKNPNILFQQVKKF